MFKLKRIYEPYDPSDGYRILVDRIWPRGISKEKARIDLWMKNIAPSDALRKWFGHDPERWKEFQRRYAYPVGQHGNDNLDHLAAPDDGHFGIRKCIPGAGA
jgi:uncharacterized protein YeaO (DUF488 family)